MKYWIFRIPVIILEFVIYAVFGGLCAFAFLAFGSTSNTGRARFSESSSVQEFLSAESPKKMEFTWDQLNGGVFSVILNCASAASRDGATPSMPSAPRFSCAGGNLLSISVPVSGTSPLFGFSFDARFNLAFDGSPRLAEAFIGGAKVPAFASSELAKAVLSHYSEVAGLDAYIAAASKIKAIDATPHRIIISK